jgi:threonine/homoserine/homoserine lactone efflux protein
VSRRARILSFGAAAVVTLAGVAAAVAGGLVGQVLAIALITLGLGGALLLIFFEVGLSEDRARERDEERSRRRDVEEAQAARPAGPRRRWRRRPS